MMIRPVLNCLGEAYLSSEMAVTNEYKQWCVQHNRGIAADECRCMNPLIEPLGMASVKAGQVDKVTFNMNGTNTKADATVLFLYHDLKMKILKKGW
jgi:hypothetical protein